MLPADRPIRTLVDLHRHAVGAAKPDLLNYKHDRHWVPISNTQLDEQVRAVALGLHHLGIRSGDRVGLLAENSPQWTIADLGTLNCGAADVPIYATQSPTQVTYLLKDGGIEVLFISNRAQYDRVIESLRASPSLRTIVAFEPWETDDRRVIPFAQLLEEGRAVHTSQPHLFESLRSAVTPDSLATLIYTSGTTGEPKGVMLTHANIVSNVLSSDKVIPLSNDSIALSFLPLSHIFERSGFYLYLYGRATIHYAEGVDHVARNLLEVRPHFLTSVPRLFEKMYDLALERAESRGRLTLSIAHWAFEIAKEWAKLKSTGRRIPAMLELKRTIATRLFLSKWRAAMGGRIRYFISGGAPLSTELAEVFYGAGMPILQGYGLTESSPVITANTPNENRLGSVGRPIPGVSVRIADDGEVLCSGPNVMKGYFNKPSETQAALKADAEGRVWLQTGDIGHFDNDGFLFITDRKKDLLKTSGGKYIAPQPIESAIKQSRFVNQIVVIGDERKFPAALIVPNMEALASYAKLKGINHSSSEELLKDPRIIDLFERQVAKYTENLSQFEKIKRVALIPNELTVESGELTPTLKVRRRVVVEKHKDVIEELYRSKESIRNT
ncbi:MAG: long-chain fatty acid--CoA ligase [Acidobacteriota bacterium]